MVQSNGDGLTIMTVYNCSYEKSVEELNQINFTNSFLFFELAFEVENHCNEVDDDFTNKESVMVPNMDGASLDGPEDPIEDSK